MNPSYKPRLTVELREDQYHRLNQLLTHGQRKQIFQILVDDLVSALEKHGPQVIAGIYTRTINVGSISKPFRATELTPNEPTKPAASPAPTPTRPAPSAPEKPAPSKRAVRPATSRRKTERSSEEEDLRID